MLNDLNALLAILSPIEEGTLPVTNGHLVHGAFFSLIRASHPDIADKWHNNDPYRPFTLSGIIFPSHLCHNRKILINKNSEYSFRITCLTEEAINIVQAALTSSSILRIQNIKFKITGLSTKTHKLTGKTNYDFLYHKWLKNNSRQSKKIKFNFHSPTAFKAGNINMVLPDIKRIFDSLTWRWNFFQTSGNMLPEVTASDWHDTWIISHFNLQSRILDFGNHKQLGFKGLFTLSLKDNSEDAKHIARLGCLLADYAFYAGIGYGTTKGMGMVNVEF